MPRLPHHRHEPLLGEETGKEVVLHFARDLLLGAPVGGHHEHLPIVAEDRVVRHPGAGGGEGELGDREVRPLQLARRRVVIVEREHHQRERATARAQVGADEPVAAAEVGLAFVHHGEIGERRAVE
jgi:hypothetical protein